MSFVVDASTLVYANISGDDGAGELRQRLRNETVHAPHLVDAELGNVLRRHVLRGAMTSAHGSQVLQHAPRLIDHRYDHVGFVAMAAWALRENVSFYDAIYVSLAAALDVPLVTVDSRLSSAPKLPCVIETPRA